VHGQHVRCERGTVLHDAEGAGVDELVEPERGQQTPTGTVGKTLETGPPAAERGDVRQGIRFLVTSTRESTPSRRKPVSSRCTAIEPPSP